MFLLHSCAFTVHLADNIVSSYMVVCDMHIHPIPTLKKRAVSESEIVQKHMLHSVLHEKRGLILHVLILPCT
jgi:hypothetical protein